MRITVKEGGRNVFHLVLPTRLLFNHLTIGLAGPALKKLSSKVKSPQIATQYTQQLSHISYWQYRKLLVALYRYRRKHGVIHLVEVVDHEGTEVYVDL